MSSEPSEGGSDEDELETDMLERKLPTPIKSRGDGSQRSGEVVPPNSPPRPFTHRRRSNAAADISTSSGRYPTPPTSRSSTGNDGRPDSQPPISIRKSASKKKTGSAPSPSSAPSRSNAASIIDSKIISSASTSLAHSLTDFARSMTTTFERWKTTQEIDFKSKVGDNLPQAGREGTLLSNSCAPSLDWSQRIRQKSGFLGVFIDTPTPVKVVDIKGAPTTDVGDIHRDVEILDTYGLEMDDTIENARKRRSTTRLPLSTLSHSPSGSIFSDAQLPSSPPIKPSSPPSPPRVPFKLSSTILQTKTMTSLEKALAATFAANAQLMLSPSPRVQAKPKPNVLHRYTAPPPMSASASTLASESAQETTRRVYARRAKENVVYKQQLPYTNGKAAQAYEANQEKLERWCKADVAPVRFRKTLENRETSLVAMNVRFLLASMKEKHKVEGIMEEKGTEWTSKAVHEMPDSVALEELIEQTFGTGRKNRGRGTHKPSLKSKRSTPASDLRSTSPSASPRAESVPISVGRQPYGLASEDEIDMLIIPDLDTISSTSLPRTGTYSTSNILQADKQRAPLENLHIESVLGKRMREEMVIVQPAVAFVPYDQVEDVEDIEETPPESPTTTNKRAKMDHEEKPREEPDREVENEHAEWAMALLGLIKGKRKLETPDLRILHKILTDVYTQRKEIEPSSELAQAVHSVSQLSAADVPGSDALGLRALARTSARTWGLTNAAARNQ